MEFGAGGVLDSRLPTQEGGWTDAAVEPPHGHPLVVAFLLGEGESHEAGLLILLEISWQEIAVAHVWEELLGPASRLGLHGPLPRAQELRLCPAVEYAGAILVELIDSSREPLEEVGLAGGDVRRHGDLLRRFELQL